MHAHSLIRQLMKRDDDISVPDPLNPDLPAFQLSRAGSAIAGVTLIVTLVIWISVRYTLGAVVLRLASIERAEPGVSLEPLAYAEDAEIQQPGRDTCITSRIRKTIGHLQNVGGFWARWRGAGCAICYQLAFMVLGGILTAGAKGVTFGKLPYIDQVVGSLLASFALAHWQAALTHIVVSEPSPKRWIHRVPPFRRTLKNVWLATAIHELASRVTVVVPMGLAYTLGLVSAGEQSTGAVIGKVILVSAVALLLYVTLAIPSGVALTRVQASMLPDEDETIVPFDRSFGGKVDPAIVGGSGALGFGDAWRSLDKEARSRILKLCLKIALIEAALWIACGIVFGINYAIFSVKR